MCIIVDNDISHKIFLVQDDPNFGPVRNALLKGQIEMVYGGKNRDELINCRTTAKYIAALDKSGIARVIPDLKIEAEKKKINAKLKSNDSHVIALALASSAKILCTNDKNLISDFTNKDLINGGNVYKYSTHINLLNSCKRHITNKFGRALKPKSAIKIL